MPINTLNLNVNAADLLHAEGTPGLDSFITAGGRDVINLVRIPGEQQVMLRVTVAEVNRTAARTIGINFNLINTKGVTVFGQQTGGITVSGNVLSQNLQTQAGQISRERAPDLGQRPGSGRDRSSEDAELRSLAGRADPHRIERDVGLIPSRRFVSGSGNWRLLRGGSTALQGVQFVPYGVQVTFTPTITDRDRIRLLA